MHILFVADGDNKYGALHSMKQLIKGMTEYRKDVKISVVLPIRIDLMGELGDYYRYLGCDVYKVLYEPFYQGVPYQIWKLPAKYIIRGMEYLLGRWTAVYCLGKKINMSTVDIIHSNSSRDDLGALLAIRYNKPLVWHIREFDDKHYKCYSYRKDYISLMNQSAIKFIAVSDAVKAHWIKKGIDSQKIIRVYDGVDAAKKGDGRNENDKVKFLMLGGINEPKGQYQVIQALNLLNPQEREGCTVDFVGDGAQSYMKRLAKIVEKERLSSSVHFLGYQKDFQKNIGNYDCGLMCSKSEGFGRVTAEYMMEGLPVIASDTGANPELVVENENGLLYKWNNIDDLKTKIIYLLNHSEELKQMGQNARDYARLHFTLKLNVKLVYEEYLKILS